MASKRLNRVEVDHSPFQRVLSLFLSCCLVAEMLVGSGFLRSMGMKPLTR